MADAYLAGARVKDIAEQAGLSKDRVIVQLNKAGVERRPRSMSEQQIDDAVRLYESGLSLARIGERLGFMASTVQLRLRERGVVLEIVMGGFGSHAADRR